MKAFKLMPMGAALLALGLGLFSSAIPSIASDRDEDSGARGQAIIRVAQDDRDQDNESDSGYLGVQVQRLSASLRRAKGIPESTEGTLVSSVEDQSPADQAGIKRGDVILQVNREETSNPGDLVRIVRSLDPGRRVSVQVWRDGVTKTFTLRVGARPEGSDIRIPPTPPSWNDRGDDREMRDMPDGTRMQILRRNRDDLERQVQELKEQISRLEREIHEMQAQIHQQQNRRDHDDRDRNDDRDRDNNEDD